MVQIDLARLSITEANRQMKAMAADGNDIEVLNPDARHHIGVGLVAPVTVRIRGSAGYFCAGLADGARFEVEGNAGWGLADNIYNGIVSVSGNASTIAGVAIRGAEVVVKGNLGSRAGQVMKAGTLLCAGNASFMAGYMMYGGRIIILGNSGEKVGEDMIGGEIYVGGKLQSLGSDAREFDVSAAESSAVAEFLERHRISHSGRFRKIGNAGTKLRYKAEEERIRPIPFFNFSGDAPYWNRKVQEDIFVKSKIGRYRIRGYGAARRLPHFSDIGFRSDLSAPVDDENLLEKVKLDLRIGDKSGAQPLRLSMPVMVAAMSYGALSKSTKIALSIASRLSGTSENTGEGGLTDAQRKEADQVIMQCLGGRLGWNIHDMLRANALEIYISQGAKPGLGGLLPAAKITREIADIRCIPMGKDCASPPGHAAFHDVDSMLDFVETLAAETGLPVGIKSAVGEIEFWEQLADQMATTGRGVDFITIDGGEGGTGAAPLAFSDHVALPFKLGFSRVYRVFAERGLQNRVVFIGSGKLGFPAYALLAFALGCDMINLGREAMLAIGCIQAQRCHTGHCPTGVATQTRWLMRGLDPTEKAPRLANYIVSMRKELIQLSRACGVAHPSQVCGDHLEVIDDHFGTRSVKEIFGYKPAWGVPCPEEQPKKGTSVSQRRIWLR